MSKGRSRHQASRRRMYSASEDRYWLSDQVAAIEIEEGLEFEAPTTFAVAAPRRRASAA